MTPSLESLFAGAGFADIPASALQRAILRAADGLPIGDELSDADVLAHFGCQRSAIGLALPVVLVLVCGVRSGKSFIVACGALHDVFAADCSRLKPHEVARHAIVAPTVDNASATFRLLLGIVESSPVLRAMVVGSPTADTVVLRRSDGRQIEIVVVAAHRGGTTLRSRWLAGATLEEVALFGVESQGAVINAEELLRAAEGRTLPGTQVRIVSSPMGPQGLLHSLYSAHFGKPGRVLVVHAPTQAMNPTFPLEKIEAVRARDPDAAAREYDARWIDGDTTFLHGMSIDASVRPLPAIRLPDPRSSYAAAMDAATRGNSWTLAIARMVDGKRAEVALAHEWKGSREKPLSPEQTLSEIATTVRGYRIREIDCDAWAFDALQDHARRVGLTLVVRSPKEQNEAYSMLQSLVTAGQLELPPIEHVASDLKLLRKVLTPNGFKVVLPRTPDGRHCDFAPSIALAVAHAGGRRRGGGWAMVEALRTRQRLEEGRQENKLVEDWLNGVVRDAGEVR